MNYLPYVVPAVVTFLIALYAFFKDAEAAKDSRLNWVFVIITGLLWPLTLPFIIWKRLASLFHLDRTETILKRHHWVS